MPGLPQEITSVKNTGALIMWGIFVLFTGILMLRGDLSKKKFNVWDYLFSYKNASIKLILFGLLLLALAVFA